MIYFFLAVIKKSVSFFVWPLELIQIHLLRGFFGSSCSLNIDCDIGYLLVFFSLLPSKQNFIIAASVLSICLVSLSTKVSLEKVSIIFS